MKKPNDKDGSEDKKMLCSAKVVENSVVPSFWSQY